MIGEDYFSYSSLVYYDGSVYYFTEVGGKLIRINLSTNELSVVFQIDSKNEYLSYRKLVLRGDVIYMIPYYRTSLISFNLTTGDSKVIEFPAYVAKKVGERPQYFGAYIDGNLIYMYGFNHTVTCYDFVYDSFSIFEADNKGDQLTTWFRSGCCKIENCICIPFYEKPYMLVINDGYCEVKKININNSNDFSFAELFLYDGLICYIRENESGNVYIDLFNDLLMKVPYRSYEIKVNDGLERADTQIPFLTWSLAGDKLILLPGYTNAFCLFDLKTGEYSNVAINKYLSEDEYCVGRRCFFDIALDGDIIYSLLYRTNILCKWNNNDIVISRVNVSEIERKDYINSNLIVKEEKIFPKICDLISNITGREE